MSRPIAIVGVPPWDGVYGALTDDNPLTFVTSPCPVTADPLTCVMDPMTDPGVDTGHTLTVQVAKDPADAEVLFCTVQWLDGTDNSVIAETTLADVPSTPTVIALTLTAPEAADVNYAQCKVRIRPQKGVVELPGCGTLALTGLAPTVISSQALTAMPGCGTLALTGLAPEVSVESGDIIYADSPSYADVAAAVASASPGDTVVVPAGDGSETWSSTLTLTRGIRLQGPGREALTLTRGNTIISIEPSETACQNDELFKVTGFTFDGNDQTSLSSPIVSVSGRLSVPIPKKIVIGDCQFQDCLGAAIRVYNQARGVVYGNIFDRCYMPIRYYGDSSSGEWDTWGDSREFGTEDQMFFESNTIQFTRGAVSDGGYFDIGDCARLVCRYNTWDMSPTTGTEIWDVHGPQNFPGGQHGNMVAEYYGNTFINVGAGSYRWMFMRGGWCLIFNNIATGNGSLPIEISNYTGGCDIRTGYPEQTDNTYVWNNTHKGSEVSVGVNIDDCDDDPSETNGPLVLNHNYYTLNTSFNGTTEHGVGRGTSAPGGSCTNTPRVDANGQAVAGDAYWVANPATPTTTSSVVQAGRLYKYIDGSWQVYYAPYTYPHPLRSS